MTSRLTFAIWSEKGYFCKNTQTVNFYPHALYFCQHLYFLFLNCYLVKLYLRASLVSSVGKESVYNAGDPGSILGSGRYPGEGNGNPLRYSCLEYLMDRGVWQTTVHGVARVGHDLVIKPPPSQAVYILIYYWHDIFQAVL